MSKEFDHDDPETMALDAIILESLAGHPAGDEDPNECDISVLTPEDLTAINAIDIESILKRV